MTDRTPVELLRDLLGPGRSSGRAQTAHVCPAHDDRRPSLDVREGADGRALVLCRAGCATVDVLAALGLREHVLFPDTPLDRPGAVAEPPLLEPMKVETFVQEAHELLLFGPDAGPARRWLRGRGVTGDDVRRHRLGLGPGMPDGRTAFGRLAGRILYRCGPSHLEGRVCGELKCYRRDRKYQSEGPKRPWGIDDLDPSRSVVLVEGPFDRIALERHDVRAVALRGKTLQSRWAGVLAGQQIRMAYVCLDGDTTRDDRQKVCRSLRRAGVAPIVVVGFEDDPGALLDLDDDQAWPALLAAMANHPESLRGAAA